MITYVAGTRPGRALFTAESRAVVVDLESLTASAVFPDYEIIPEQWERTPDPSDIPTQAFAVAEDAFTDIVTLTASGRRSGKRTYAVPKNVRDAAARALVATADAPVVPRSVASHLASGKPVSYDTVRHVNMFFEHADITGKADHSELWGGDAGERWAQKIVAKEMSLVAAASKPHDLGLSERGAMNPAPSSETIEDDPGPEEPWGSVDPDEPHVFVPLSAVNSYDCAYCFADEGALIHTDSMREQVMANYGEGSEELAAYDEYLAQFDEPSPESENAAPVSASGPLFVVEPEIGTTLLASAFFIDQNPMGECDYHVEHSHEDDTIHRIFVRRPDDTWGQWNPGPAAWEDAGDASDAELEPIDDNAAYVAAMRQIENGGMPVPVRDLHTVEWAAADAAQYDVADEVDGFEEMDPDFYVEIEEDDPTHVYELYAQRAGLWFRWDKENADWVASPEPTGISRVDEEDAEQIARWLSWADDGTDPGDDSVVASLAELGYSQKKKTRANRADRPGFVPNVSSRRPGSRRTPYSSNTLPGGQAGQSWFSSPRTTGKGSGGASSAPGSRVNVPSSSSDSGYTPQERSANAKQQVRDGFGRFAKGGSRVQYSGGEGTIRKVDVKTKQVQVESDPDANGKTTTSWVDAKSTKVQPGRPGSNIPGNAVVPVKKKGGTSPYSTSNDGGEVWLPADGPRATAGTAKAHLGKLQKPLTSAELDKMLADTSAYFARERANAKKINPAWNSSRSITASANHDGVMVAFFLDEDSAAKYAVEGGEPPEALHMTLAYLGDQGEVPVDAEGLARIVGAWAAQTSPVTGEISGSGVFTNGEKPVTHLSVDCPSLPEARQSLIEHLEANGLSPRKNHGFDPHITLAYDDVPVEAAPHPVTFDHVVVSHGERDLPIPLGGNAMAAAAEVAMTPDTSDVAPLRLAIVDSVDKSAVLELLSLVPASATSTEPVLFKRTAKGWERDDALMSSLRSATPPPVVTLDDQTYPGVLTQVDSALSASKEDPVAASAAIELYNEFGELLPAMVAVAGKAVTPKDFASAERLRKYWTVGPGGAKIRWGQGGDFNRCVRHLTKYLGPRAKGYCQLRHHDVLGYYTGTHAKMLGGKHGRRGVRGSAGFEIPDEKIRVELLAAWDRAEAAQAAITAGAVVEDPTEGARFRIPVVLPEGVPTGDGRIFKPLSGTWRNLPLPLLWQMKTADGHDGSVIAGRIDSIERIANGLGNAYGVFDTSPHGREVERLVRNGFLRGVSADLDNFEAEVEKAEELGKESGDKSEKIAPDTTTISKARVMAVTAVPKPAFQECTIEIIEDEPELEAPVITDGVYSERDDEALVACALVASQIPVVPPADWFTNPALREPTPLTVTDDGRVYGHIAAWHVDHIGLPFGTKPPKSRSGYRYFHTGVVRTDSGKDVPVGQLTLAGGHAGLELTADAAVKHYDDTKSAVADVHAGEDQFGIWVAGALRPDVDAGKIRTLRASAPSGDWRPINGRLELVAVCQVNVPGFPVARARVASGYVTALVAAGAAPLAQLKGLSVEDRVQRLEQEALAAKMEAVRQRMAPAIAEHAETLALRASAARERIEALRAGASTGYDADQLEAFSHKGWALPDGSFAIANAADLRAAVVAYSSLASCDKPGARRHIMKRARGLGHVDLIPSSWTSASVEERWQDARATFTELASRSRGLTASAGIAAAPETLLERDKVIERMNALRAAGTSDVDPNRPALPTKGRAVVDPIVDKAPKFEEHKHPRFDSNGQFRQVLTRLRSGVEGEPGTETIARQIDHVVDLMDSEQLGEIQSATQGVMKAIKDRADANPNDSSAEVMRAGFKDLGTALAKLPLPQGQDTVTMRWSDLPIQLQNLVEDVMTKLKGHLTADAFKEVTAEVASYQAGVDYATSDQIQSWLAKMTSHLLD